MEERQSRLSNMDWKRFRPYLCVRLIPQNSMFSNFCHVLKTKGNCCEYRVYSFPYEKHRYLGDIYGTYKLTSEAVAVLFGYVKFCNSMVDSERKTAELIKIIFSITYSRISENEYKSYLI